MLVPMVWTLSALFVYRRSRSDESSAAIHFTTAGLVIAIHIGVLGAIAGGGALMYNPQPPRMPRASRIAPYLQ